MIHGLLLDQCGEFMIQKADRSDDNTAASAGLRAEDTGIAFEWHRGFQVTRQSPQKDTANRHTSGMDT